MRRFKDNSMKAPVANMKIDAGSGVLVLLARGV
jgi:hypothetical protein